MTRASLYTFLFLSLLTLACGSARANTVTTSSISGSPFLPGATVSVPFTISGTFSAGNTFTAELSDASGSFSAPVSIGSLVSITAGTVSATIPASATGGSGYRIRVTATSPATTGSDNGTDLSISEPFNALNFDGSDDRVALSNISPISSGTPGEYTVEVWVKVASYGDFWIYGDERNGNHGILMQLNSSGYIWTYNPSVGTVTSSAKVPLNTWTHIAFVQNASVLMLYVNGAFVQNLLSAPNLHIETNDAEYLGAFTGNQSSFSRFFNGSMDELRVWNRALCQSEIQNNMNGELPNPTTQNGLVAYYKFDQAIASGTNTGVTNLLDASGNGKTGTLVNFALGSTSSNWLSGATAITGNVSAYTSTALSSATETSTEAVAGTTTFNGCGVVALASPTGTSTALSGPVTTTVTIDGSVNNIGGQAYVQRHYEILPSSNATTATADVTLYFTQAEFTAFNAARGSMPLLPVDATDAANNRANLRISQFHGTPTGGYAPQNYPSTWGGVGPAHVLITPTSVSYNSTYACWQVVVPVTGFSGFFASTNTLAPLPIGLSGFTATLRNEADVLLNWTAYPQPGYSYVAERSADGQHFSVIGNVDAGATESYSLHDYHPLGGKSYYRIHQLARDGEGSYSVLQSVFNGRKSGFDIYPSPAASYVVLSTDGTGGTATLSDLEGHVLRQFAMQNGMRLDISELPSGVYMMRTDAGEVAQLVKE